MKVEEVEQPSRSKDIRFLNLDKRKESEYLFGYMHIYAYLGSLDSVFEALLFRSLGLRSTKRL